MNLLILQMKKNKIFSLQFLNCLIVIFSKQELLTSLKDIATGGDNVLWILLTKQSHHNGWYIGEKFKEMLLEEFSEWLTIWIVKIPMINI